MTNLTLAIEEDLLREARRLAVERNTSVNQLVREYLAELVSQQDRRQQAWERIERRMRERTAVIGPRTWTRDDLHAR
jgi:hypothetical protein